MNGEKTRLHTYFRTNRYIYQACMFVNYLGKTIKIFVTKYLQYLWLDTNVSRELNEGQVRREDWPTIKEEVHPLWIERSKRANRLSPYYYF